MKPPRGPALYLICLLLASVAPLFAQNRTVSASAFGALVIESPNGFFTDTDAFIANSGLSAALDGKTLKEKLFTDADGEKALKAVDLSKPLVVSFEPYKDGTQMAAVLWLPLKSGDASFKLVSESFTGDGPRAARVGDWAAVCMRGEPPKALPAKAADLSALKRYGPNTVKVWINLTADTTKLEKSWLESFSVSFKAEEKKDPNLPKSYYSDEPGMREEDILDNPAFAGFRPLYDSFRPEIASLTMDLEFNAQGARVVGGIGFVKGSRLEKFSSGAGKGLPFFKFLDPDALIAGTSSFDNTACPEVIDALMQAYSTIPLFGDRYVQFASAISKGQGKNSAFAFDLSLDKDLKKKVSTLDSPDKIPDFLRKAFDIRIAGISEVRDQKTLRSAIASLSGGGVLTDLMKQSLGSLGLNLTLEVSKGTIAGIEYDTLTPRFGVSALTGAEGGAALKPSFDVISEKLTMCAGYNKGQMYLTTGSPKDMQKLVGKGLGTRSPESDVELAKARKMLPVDTFSLSFISIKKLLGLVAVFTPQPIKTDGLDRLYIYAAGSAGFTELGMYLSSKDIKAIADDYGMMKGW